MRYIAALMALALLASPAAAKTETFAETSADQFAAGHSEGVVGTSLGTLRLGRALDSLLKDAEGVDYVARMAEAPDGTVYAVTGGEGRVYRLKGDKADLFATLGDKFLFSAAVDAKGVLYVGSGGQKGRIWRIQTQGDPKPEVMFEADDVKYIWDLACAKDGSLVAATGDQGRLLRITADGKSEVLIASKAHHVLCLAMASDGAIYAGTDAEAVVYRYADKKSFVLYDAEEAEITGLALDGEGNLYVGVSSGAGGRAGGALGSIQKLLNIPISPPSMKGGLGDGEAEKSKAAEKPAGSEPPKKNGNGQSPAAQPPKPSVEAVPTAPPPTPSVPPTPKGGEAKGSGVYRIAPDGIATRFFDGRDAMVLGLAVADKHLLVATGRDAHIYEVALDGDRGENEESCIATVDPKQAMAILVTKAGRAVVATAAPGRLYALSKGFAKEGTYTSKVYDAGGSAKWGMLEWRGQTPGGTQVRLASRTGNQRDPDKGGWSDWSKDLAASGAKIESPAARFVQFRVSMKTGSDAVTPVLDQFEAVYLRVNEPPKIASFSEAGQGEESARAQNRASDVFRQALKARGREGAPSGPAQLPRGGGRQPLRGLTWQAVDPDGDELRYDLYFRSQGETKWILLEKDLVQPTYVWDTSTVADGWYEVKVIASDRVDNPPETALEGFKVSDPILVDNTAPVIEKLEAKAAKGEVEVKFSAADAQSRLVAAGYTVDSSLEWHSVFPTDEIFDSQKKDFRFVIKDLPPGPHRIAVRVSDQAGNTVHADKSVTVEK
jgi:sugar lactone lactonase YvrE